MRWPFSLLFRGDRDASAGGDADPAASGGPDRRAGDGAAAGSFVAPRPAAWRTLPPIQRAAGEIPLTVPALQFGRELATRRPAERFVGPLAHDLAADGPAGLVSGIATPLARPASLAPAHPEAPTLPARRGLQRRGRSVSVAEDPGAAAVDHSVTPAADVVLEPPRPLPAVAAGAAGLALAATRVGPASAPQAIRATAPAAGAPVQRSSPAVTAPVTPTGPAEVAGPPTVRDGSAAEQESSTPPGAQVQRRTLGESRRLGLGAPLEGRPTPRAGLPSTAALPLARGGRPSGAPAPAVPDHPAARPATAASGPLPLLRMAASVGTPDTGGPVPAVDQEMTPGAPAGEPEGRSVLDAGDGAPAGDLADVGGGGPTASAAARPLVGDPGRQALGLDVDHAAVARGGLGEGGAGGESSAELPLVARLATGTGAAADAADRSLPRVPGGSGAAVAVAAGTAPGATAAAPSAAVADGRGVGPPAPAPLVPARAPLGTRPPLGSSLGSIPDGPAPVVARRSAGSAIDGGDGPDGPWQAVHGRAPAALPGTPSSQTGMGPVPGAAEMGSRFEGASGLASPLQRHASAAGPLMAAPAVNAIVSGEPTASLPRSPVRAPLPVARAAASLAPSPAAAWSGPAAVEEPVVSRLASVAGASPGRSPLPGPGWTPASGFGAPPPEGGPYVQRAVALDEVTSEVGSADSAAAGGAGGQDYEEIADRVYDRIRSRFATELLLDRERMGLLIDG